MSTKERFGNALPKARKAFSIKGNFANNNTIRLEGFVTVHVENSLGETWRQLAINIRYRRGSRCDGLVVALLWLLGHFYYLRKSWSFSLEKWSLTDWVFSDSYKHWSLSTNIIIIQLINAFYARIVQNLACWCVQAGKCYGLMSFCDVGHTKIGLTNLTNYWVQQFLYSFVLFQTLDSTKYLRINNLGKNRNASLLASDGLG